MQLKSQLKQKGRQLGFDLIAVTSSDPINEKNAQYLSQWLAAGHAGDMAYMYRNVEKRINPSELLPNAKSVICLALNYRPHLRPCPGRQRSRIANFALYRDYHIFMKELMRELVSFMEQKTPDTTDQYKICVDSVPLAERALAQRAGLGFIGKNHMLINPDLGSQLLLGEIVTTLKLAPDTPMPSACKNCCKCIKACPTGALQPENLDASKCISYLTSEHKGPIPVSLSTSIGPAIFGCDLCMLACPYENNASSAKCSNSSFTFYPERGDLDPAEVVNWTEREFEQFFSDSSVKRLGLDRLKRNAAICLKNTRTQNEK